MNLECPWRVRQRGMPEMPDRVLIENELKSLRDQLADAWWHEAPLENIQYLEREIEYRWRLLNDAGYARN